MGSGQPRPCADCGDNISARNTRCSTCAGARRIIYRREYKRRTRLKEFYGLSVADYERMVNEQEGLCATCGSPERAADSRTGKVRSLSVDHCHRTGRVRGLLCNRCNVGVVKSVDDLIASFGYATLARALDYCAPADRRTSEVRSRYVN